MKIACVFPGQGSQQIGMGKDFYEQFKIARKIFDIADQTLGIPLTQLCFEGPREKLNLTPVTQPALLTVSTAIAAVFKEQTNIEISFVAGHSLGEYSALCFAECFPFETAVKLVRIRGEAMQEATPEGVGSMAALIGISVEAAIEVCSEAAQNQILQPANFNSPGQVVISGHKEAVMRGITLAKEKGAKRAILLPVSAPFHCNLMQPAADRMKMELAKISLNCPKFPVVNNVDASQIAPDPEKIRSSLVRQVTCPVKWEQSLRYLAKQNIDTIVEIGPGKVLTNLAKRTIPKCERFAVNSVEGLNTFIERIL